MSEARRYARVPATLGRAGWQRSAEHTAEAGNVKAWGKSAASALDALGEALGAMADRAHEPASVWWDAANRSLWIAYPDAAGGGYRAVRVHMLAGEPGRVYAGMSGSGPASEAFANAEGMTRVR